MNSNTTKLRSSRRIKFLIIFLSVILIVMMFPRGESIEFEVSINSIWLEDDLIASMPFEILKDPVIYQRERAAAANSIHQIFVKVDTVPSMVMDSLTSYNQHLITVMDSDIFLESEAVHRDCFL